MRESDDVIRRVTRGDVMKWYILLRNSGAFSIVNNMGKITDIEVKPLHQRRTIASIRFDNKYVITADEFLSY